MKIKLIQFQSGRALPPKILQVLPRGLLITTKKSENAKQLAAGTLIEGMN